MPYGVINIAGSGNNYFVVSLNILNSIVEPIKKQFYISLANN